MYLTHVFVFLSQLSPYPTEGSLQNDLSTAVNWNAYKKAILDQMVAIKAQRKHFWHRNGVAA